MLSVTCGAGNTRHNALYLAVISSKLTCLVKVFAEYLIISTEQVFNLEESGISTKTQARGKAKAAMDGHARQEAIDLEFRANADHLTLMPVVFACGMIWDPVVIITGTCQKYRIRQKSVCETPCEFLPPRSMVSYRTPASMTIPIFEQWENCFVKQTAELRTRNTYILLRFDGFGGHASVETL